LGVRHPDKPGAYLAGVECDGATYHRSAVARDRDKTRQMVLENLGWNILRVWSPDWWYDAATATATLDQDLTKLLEESRASQRRALDVRDEPAKEQTDPGLSEPVVTSTEAQEINFVASSIAKTEFKIFFARVQLADVAGNQSRFYDPYYDDELRLMAIEVLKQEAPIRDDILAKQIARAHGFARTGANIRSRILDLLSDVVATEESTGRFL